MTERRLHWGWLVVAALLIGASPTWLQWINSALEDDDARSVPTPPPALSVLPPSALEAITNQEFFARARSVKADPVSSAADLKRVFDEYKDSTDPRERRAAARAFQTCVPAFLPRDGKPASPEPFIESLPRIHRSEREAAYRSLFERCEGLLALQPAVLTATLEALRTDPQAQAPGVLAQQAALVGYPQRVEELVTEALTSNDPASVASLAGLAARIAVVRQGEVADAVLLQEAQAVDEALPLVACDLGLDCGEQSLWALKLCAFEALCKGDASTRLIARSARNGIKPDAVLKERQRLLRLIQTGRIAGAMDLLPER